MTIFQFFTNFSFVFHLLQANRSSSFFLLLHLCFGHFFCVDGIFLFVGSEFYCYFYFITKFLYFYPIFVFILTFYNQTVHLRLLFLPIFRSFSCQILHFYPVFVFFHLSKANNSSTDIFTPIFFPAFSTKH